ncbi:MAG: hypothetical protein JRE47_14630, partial [Deltaproteobacteria bacterium]|nr:hypothetical protein [Deltaproteobacteria bacterium]
GIIIEIQFSCQLQKIWASGQSKTLGPTKRRLKNGETSDKITDPFAFSEVIYNYRILPEVFINPLAIWLPWLELLAGLCLIIGIYINGGVLIISFLSLSFAIALGSALLRGLDISCGCFYSSGTKRIADWVTIAQDLWLLIMGIQVLFFDKAKYALNLRIKSHR